MFPIKKYAASAVPLFVPLAVVLTVLTVFTYVAVQQNYRQNANDPQIEYAEGLAKDFSGSGAVPTIKPSIDIAKSLSTWVAVFDDTGKVLQSSGVLNNKGPSLPVGVFDQAKAAGQDRITWQPQAGVRVALVVASYEGTQSSGYVAVGRSLREVENRISMLGWYALAAWLAALVLLFASLVLMEMWRSRPHNS